jgi:hypothetical protein
MSRKSTAQQRALLLLAFVIAMAVYACAEFAQTHWRSGFGALLLVLAFVLWILMTKIPSACGVWKKDNKGYCRNPIDGLFFGCNKHTWLRPLGFIGLGRKPRPVVPVVEAYASLPLSAGSPNGPAGGQEVREDTRNRVLFYATMVATTAGCISMLTDIFGFFSDFG